MAQIGSGGSGSGGSGSGGSGGGGSGGGGSGGSGSGGGSTPPAGAVDLGTLLIKSLNPYANNSNPFRGAPTGPVDIYTAAPPSWAPSGTPPTPPDIGQVELEMESNYPAEWAFKGQPQKVYKTVRIKYRYPVLSGPLIDPATGRPPSTPATVLYWIDDYMLIGFEGGPGG